MKLTLSRIISTVSSASFISDSQRSAININLTCTCNKDASVNAITPKREKARNRYRDTNSKEFFQRKTQKTKDLHEQKLQV